MFGSICATEAAPPSPRGLPAKKPKSLASPVPVSSADPAGERPREWAEAHERHRGEVDVPEAAAGEVADEELLGVAAGRLGREGHAEEADALLVGDEARGGARAGLRARPSRANRRRS